MLATWITDYIAIVHKHYVISFLVFFESDVELSSLDKICSVAKTKIKHIHNSLP